MLLFSILTLLLVQPTTPKPLDATARITALLSDTMSTSLKDKAEAIDAILQLLAEIDLPAICEAVMMDKPDQVTHMDNIIAAAAREQGFESFMNADFQPNDNMVFPADFPVKNINALPSDFPMKMKDIVKNPVADRVDTVNTADNVIIKSVESRRPNVSLAAEARRLDSQKLPELDRAELIGFKMFPSKHYVKEMEGEKGVAFGTVEETPEPVKSMMEGVTFRSAVTKSTTKPESKIETGTTESNDTAPVENTFSNETTSATTATPSTTMGTSESTETKTYSSYLFSSPSSTTFTDVETTTSNEIIEDIVGTSISNVQSEETDAASDVTPNTSDDATDEQETTEDTESFEANTTPLTTAETQELNVTAADKQNSTSATVTEEVKMNATETLEELNSTQTIDETSTEINISYSQANTSAVDSNNKPKPVNNASLEDLTKYNTTETGVNSTTGESSTNKTETLSSKHAATSTYRVFKSEVLTSTTTSQPTTTAQTTPATEAKATTVPTDVTTEASPTTPSGSDEPETVSSAEPDTPIDVTTLDYFWTPSKTFSNTDENSPSYDYDETTHNHPKVSFHVSMSSDDVASTPDDIASTPDDIASTPDDIESTSDNVNSTFDDVTSTSDDVTSTSDDVANTTDDVTKSSKNNQNTTLEMTTEFIPEVSTEPATAPPTDYDYIYNIVDLPADQKQNNAYQRYDETGGYGGYEINNADYNNDVATEYIDPLKNTARFLAGENYDDNSYNGEIKGQGLSSYTDDKHPMVDKYHGVKTEGVNMLASVDSPANTGAEEDFMLSAQPGYFNSLADQSSWGLQGQKTKQNSVSDDKDSNKLFTAQTDSKIGVTSSLATDIGIRQKTVWSEPTIPQIFFQTNSYSCPGLFGYFADISDCQAFFICSWGVPYRFRCPAGTLWSSSQTVCDWSNNVNCIQKK